MLNHGLRQEETIYTIPGKPVPLARPRFARTNDNSFKVYDSQKLSKLQAYLNMKSQHHGLPLIDYPVHLDIIFTFQIPQSYSSHKKALCLHKPYVGKSDLDNLLKFVLDVSNKVIYNDDSVVASVSAKKVYGTESMTVFSFKRI